MIGAVFTGPIGAVIRSVFARIAGAAAGGGPGSPLQIDGQNVLIDGQQILFS
jgi:hypothetical protein